MKGVKSQKITAWEPLESNCSRLKEREAPGRRGKGERKLINWGNTEDLVHVPGVVGMG